MEQTPEELEGFECVCTVDDVPEHMPRAVEVKERRVLICRRGDEFYAVDEICPHENKSMRRGVLVQNEIMCPHHQYRFNLKTGRCHRRCAPVKTYEVEVIDEQVWVRP